MACTVKISGKEMSEAEFYSWLIDGGLNETMNVSKTNFIDIVDGGVNSVRNFDGDSKLRPIIDDGGDGTLV